ncbi:hypothetical protein [Streptacidiphilus sp. P02-A3a]|nr:hypothetical protein [Streptacidiphilus sp. P02-A3a]
MSGDTARHQVNTAQAERDRRATCGRASWT